MYVDKKRIRIVYKIVYNQIIVEVIAIGKRDEMFGYLLVGCLNQEEEIIIVIIMMMETQEIHLLLF